MLIENAPGSAEDEATPEQATAVRRIAGPDARRRRSCSTRARSRPIRGSTCCSRRWRSCRRVAARRAPGARRRQAGSGRARATAGARGRHRKRRRFSPASGRRRRFPPICSPLTCSVSPRSRGTNTPLKIYQYLRSGKPIVATRLLTHTQVLERRHGDSDRRHAARIRRRHPRGALTDPTRAAAVGERARALARDEVQLRGLSRAHAPGVRGAVRRRSRPAPVRQGPRVTQKPAARPDHYSYAVYADPATARDIRRAPVRRTDRRDWSPHRRRECCCRHASGDIDGPAMLDVGTGTGRAALLLARGGRARHRRRRLRGDAGGRAATRRRRRGCDVARSCAGDAHALEFARPAVSTSPSVCAC